MNIISVRLLPIRSEPAKRKLATGSIKRQKISTKVELRTFHYTDFLILHKTGNMQDDQERVLIKFDLVLE